MKTAIEKIYRGDTNSQDFEMTDEWKRLASEVLKIYKDFYATLTEEQKKLYDEMNEYESLREADAQLQCFKQGFKFALKLVAEALLG